MKIEIQDHRVRLLTGERDYLRGWQPEMIAQTFSAYLLGSHAHKNGNHFNGPYKEEHKWQLDASNDFWLRVTPEGIVLDCRYPHQQLVLKAMAELFVVRYCGL